MPLCVAFTYEVALEEIILVQNNFIFWTQHTLASNIILS